VKGIGVSVGPCHVDGDEDAAEAAALYISKVDISKEGKRKARWQ
jgi:hypothetical protein